jgi:pyruvate kinase
MIANTVRSDKSGPTLRGHSITLEKVLVKSPVENRHTKIICTLGPACWSVETLEELIDAGMNVARFNFSHGDHEGHAACLSRLREAASNKGTKVAVLLDTKGPEIRSGFFANDAKKIELKKGETLTLTTDYEFKGDASKLACSYPSMATSVTPGQSILVADGSLVLTVLETDAATGDVKCRIENNASIGERKNMNLPGVVVDLPTLTEKDIGDIKDWGVKHNVDFVAASFVRKPEDVVKIREVLGEEGKHIQVICKIENQEGLENYDEILKVTDGIMVARGDLGMEIPPEKVFLAQKMMIRKANIAGKPVVTATQMLESMITNPRPTRAECSDVANAVLDGTDCVMLSGETANGEHPKAAVTIMARTCAEAESAINFDGLYQAVRNSVLSTYGFMTTPESVTSSAVKTALDCQASAIIVLSQSGNTARLISKFRPPMKVIVLTPFESTARQCFGILKNMDAEVVQSMSDSDAIITTALERLKASGKVSDGNTIVVVQGENVGQVGSTNTMRVITV